MHGTTTADYSHYMNPVSLSHGLFLLTQDDYRPAKRTWSLASVEMQKEPSFQGIDSDNPLADIWRWGACAGEGETFDSDRPTEAKRICAGCQVRDACLQYALTNRESGVWGGTTDSERSKMRRIEAP
jgi:WhiB family redox-sensing transcriptional regulator